VFQAVEDKIREVILERERNVPEVYRLSGHLWKYLRRYAAKHKAAGNGFGYGLVGREDVARTVSARYFKDGSEILISRGGQKNPRRLTPRECARLMGFPDSFEIPVSDTQAYKQFGNSVVVPVVQAVADRIVRCLNGEGLADIRQPSLFADRSRVLAAS
jgi:DNA (cytosine-5)-methyltransferase 1